jgi:hypothetical protein
MRPFSPQFLGRYLAAAGPQAHQSVGAYQLDGLGIQLFDRIEGDYFAISFERTATSTARRPSVGKVSRPGP